LVVLGELLLEFLSKASLKSHEHRPQCWLVQFAHAHCIVGYLSYTIDETSQSCFRYLLKFFVILGNLYWSLNQDKPLQPLVSAKEHLITHWTWHFFAPASHLPVSSRFVDEQQQQLLTFLVRD